MKKYFLTICLFIVVSAYSTTVYDIQYTTIPGPDGTYPSLLVNQVVTVTGIVTGSGYYSSGNSNRFFLSDPEGGPWKGVFVFNWDFVVAEGDLVEVTGTVIEYYGMTEISTVTNVTIISSGNPVPAPLAVPTADLVTPAAAEPYEGCLVEVQNVVVTSAQNNYGEWYVTDISAVPCQVDDGFFLLSSVTPPIVITVGMEWAVIRGCVDYSYSEYAINPRTPDDLIDTLPMFCDFSAEPLSGMVPLQVSFTDLSSGNITIWEWDFNNDGTIDSYEQNPLWIYEEVGVFTVSLTIGDGTITETEIKEDYITALISVSADFSAAPLTGLVPLDVQFTDLSTGNITAWEWDFDNDGTIDSYEHNPAYTYNTAGDYTVSLTVSDAYCTATETKVDYISVGEEIIADFSAAPLSGISPLEVQFTDNSAGNIISWEWDFDNDGTIDSYEQNPSFIYYNAGLYTVVLTVNDGTFFDTETKVDYIEVTEIGTQGDLPGSSAYLAQNYPNPFNPETAIEFNVPQSFATLEIYNMRGERILSETFGSGYHKFLWNAEGMASGIYFYKLASPNTQLTRKMLLLR